MAEPLIDRDELLLVVFRATRSRDETPYPIADAVLTYLREVLTPEALDQPRNPEGLYHGDVIITGTGMHRRIFGVTDG